MLFTRPIFSWVLFALNLIFLTKYWTAHAMGKIRMMVKMDRGKAYQTIMTVSPRVIRRLGIKVSRPNWIPSPKMRTSLDILEIKSPVLCSGKIFRGIPTIFPNNRTRIAASAALVKWNFRNSL